MTLLEVVVACALSSLVALAILSMLVFGRSLYYSGAVRVTNFDQISRAVSRIATEVRDSEQQFCVCSDGTLPALAFASARDAHGKLVTDDQGKPVYQKWIVYLVLSEQLRRYEVTDKPYTQTTVVAAASQLFNPCQSRTDYRVIADRSKLVDFDFLPHDRRLTIKVSANEAGQNGLSDAQESDLVVYLLH